MEVVEDNSDMA